MTRLDLCHNVNLCISPQITFVPVFNPALSVSLSIDFFFVPLFSLSHQMSARQLCSDGRAKQTVFVLPSIPQIPCTRSNTQAAMHTNKHYVACVTEGPNTAGIQDFCPRVCRFDSVFTLPPPPTPPHTSTGCIWPHQYKTDASNSLVTADKHGLLHREGQEFGSFCFLIGLGGFFLCEWLMGKWLDCRFGNGAKFVLKTEFVQGP